VIPEEESPKERANRAIETSKTYFDGYELSVPLNARAIVLAKSEIEIVSIRDINYGSVVVHGPGMPPVTMHCPRAWRAEPFPVTVARYGDMSPARFATYIHHFEIEGHELAHAALKHATTHLRAMGTIQ
jgi:hypothetical protein